MRTDNKYVGRWILCRIHPVESGGTQEIRCTVLTKEKLQMSFGFVKQLRIHPIPCLKDTTYAENTERKEHFIGTKKKSRNIQSLIQYNKP